MKFLIKIFGYIIITISFILLIFSTFISPQYKKINSLKIDNRFNKHEEINKNLFIENLSNTDSIYYTNKGSYTKKKNGNNIIIELKKGKFLFNINDLNKNYTFSYKGFNLKLLGTGIFYLDTNNENKINIISKEATLKVLFKNIDTEEILNTAFLYPHEYIIVNLKFLTPDKKNNKPPAVKNSSDFLRIKSQFFYSGYIPNSISDLNKYDDIIGKIIGKKSIDFLNNSIKDIEKKYKIELTKYKDIQKLESWSFPGVDYIEKHISYFYNPSKKVIYYKNNIIKNTLKLLSQKNTKTVNIRSNIKEQLTLLKNINKKDRTEYIKMLNFINYISYIISNNKSLSTSSILEQNNIFILNDINIIRKLNFYNLKLEINNNTKKKINLSYIYLNHTFHLYDKGKLSNINKKLNNFIILFYKDLNIKIIDGKLIYKSNYANQIDYLGFYLKNYISYILSSNVSIENSLKLINKYLILNENIYFTSLDNFKIETGIREGVSFLNKLNIFIRKTLFKKERNKRGLLKKEPINNSNIANVNELNINIDIFNKSIEKHISLIENIDLFKKDKKKFKEYFNALLDYDLYIINYDKINQDILNINTIGTNNNGKELSKDKFLKYIMQFDGINDNSINNIKVDIIDNNYYKIQKLYINGIGVSFNLYPYEGNKLNNIYISGIEKSKQLYYNSTYKLDKQKKLLIEKSKSADKKDKNKYDFKKFFLNKFFNKRKIKTTTQKNKKSKALNEDRITVIFKTTKLVGENGEFKVIKHIVNIKYNELLVKREGDKYNININGSLFTLQINKDTKPKYGLLYSKYILDNNSHYFKDINIKLYSKYETEKILFISGNKITLLGNINILDLEKELKKFLLNTQNIEYVYNKIFNNYINIDKLKIIYVISTGQIIINFKNNNNYIEILLKGSNIIYVKKNGIKKHGNDKIDNLQNILLQINN